MAKKSRDVVVLSQTKTNLIDTVVKKTMQPVQRGLRNVAVIFDCNKRKTRRYFYIVRKLRKFSYAFFRSKIKYYGIVRKHIITHVGTTKN